MVINCKFSASYDNLKVGEDCKCADSLISKIL